MSVHNHGTEQGKGLACSESLIGECLIKVGGETIEALREQIQSRPLLRNMAKRLQSEVSALEAERDGLLAMVEAHPDALRVAAASALEAAAEYSNREMFFTVTRPEIWIMLHARAAEYRKTETEGK